MGAEEERGKKSGERVREGGKRYIGGQREGVERDMGVRELEREGGREGDRERARGAERGGRTEKIGRDRYGGQRDREGGRGI